MFLRQFNDNIEQPSHLKICTSSTTSITKIVKFLVEVILNACMVESHRKVEHVKIPNKPSVVIFRKAFK